MIGYVLVTYGPKPSRISIREYAARQQLLNLRDFSKAFEKEGFQFVFDYSRSHQTLDQLPWLAWLLSRTKEHDIVVVMDDLGRLFRNVPGECRGPFLAELMQAGGRIYGIRQRYALHEADRSQLLSLVGGAHPDTFLVDRPLRRRRSKNERIEQTTKARRASALARRQQALRLAREIARVRDELLEDGQTPTLAAIAEAANAKGMRSARGNPWSTSSVSRALKRLEEEEVAEETAAA